MELSEYKNIYENEGEHFFYVSTHYLVEKLIEKYSPTRKHLAILEAGCGTGLLAKKLVRFGKVSAIDFSREAIKFARKNGVLVTEASVGHLPFKGNSFDLVTCIDVIYHKAVKDDVAALGEIKRVLRPGGFLILRVPANKHLLSAHDRHVHTARRYNKDELVRKLRKAGLHIEFISFVHAPLFPLSLIKVFVERIVATRDTSTIGSVPPIINKGLTCLLMFEARLIAAGIPLPFGQGLITVATK